MGLIGTKRILLILDGHVPRRDQSAVHQLLENNIDVLVLPANSSKYIQPLDMVAFSSLKSRISSSPDPMTKVAFLEMVEDSLSRALTRSTVKTSWKKAFLFPFDLFHILEIIPVISAPSKRRATHQTPLGGRFLAETF